MIHHIQIIGEAAGSVSSELREAHPDVPWAEIISMRNILVHQYFGIDPEEVWTTVSNDVAELKKRMASILQLLGA
jgi:uncharacterized protein with HEPN domain